LVERDKNEVSEEDLNQDNKKVEENNNK